MRKVAATECGALEASVAPAGDPQTSQYPSMMLPVQPGMRQRPVGTLATGACGMPRAAGPLGCAIGAVGPTCRLAGTGGTAGPAGVIEAAAAEWAPPGEGIPHTSQ